MSLYLFYSVYRDKGLQSFSEVRATLLFYSEFHEGSMVYFIPSSGVSTMLHKEFSEVLYVRVCIVTFALLYLKGNFQHLLHTLHLMYTVLPRIIAGRLS